MNLGEGRIPRAAAFKRFNIGDEVDHPGAQLAKDGAQLMLSPAAKGLDGKAPARGQFVFVERDTGRRRRLMRWPVRWVTARPVEVRNVHSMCLVELKGTSNFPHAFMVGL